MTFHIANLPFSGEVTENIFEVAYCIIIAVDKFVFLFLKENLSEREAQTRQISIPNSVNLLKNIVKVGLDSAVE